MSVDIVVVSYQSQEHLSGCLSAILKNIEGISDCRVVVVDNDSDDGSADLVREQFPEIELIACNENQGYGAAINRALIESRAEYVLCLNADTRLHEGAVSTLLDCAARHGDAIAVGPRLVYPDGRFHASCRRFPSVWRNFCHVTGLSARMSETSSTRSWLSEPEHARERKVDMVSGACFLIQRAYLDRVGGFDERLFLYEEEADVFLPTRQSGERVYFCPDAVVTHVHGASLPAGETDNIWQYHRLRSKYYVFRKHFGAWAAARAAMTDMMVLISMMARTINRAKKTQAYERVTRCAAAYRSASEH